jgi:hypothetical protein
MRREGLSLSHRTSICQTFPADFKGKLLNFSRCYSIKEETVQTGHGGVFNIPRTYTVDPKSEK